MQAGMRIRTVAVAGVEFGWGSSGKLSAVLSALRARGGRRLRFIGLATGLGRPVLAGQPVERWFDLPDAHLPGTRLPDTRRLPELARIVQAQRVQAALVVLDGGLAKALRACGVPVVFVDSLPFLWTDGDRPELPLDTEVYCAQRCVELPPEGAGVLADAPNLRWVDAVIAEPGTPRSTTPAPAPRRALVSLGGLRAPQLADWASYPQIVLPAALEALTAAGVDEVHIAGNLPAWLAAQLVDSCAHPAVTTVGALPHEDFLHRLADCDVLLTSPGLTTLLEAGRLAVPTLCLPPQNLSQIFNGRFHSQALATDARVTWPKEVFAEDEALALRADGEGKALDLIYGGIARAADLDRRRTTAAVRQGITEKLGRLTGSPGTDWTALTTAVGTAGAAQVADALIGLLTSPGPDG
ncbi:hydroxymethylcytosylglucuronate/cytosylglucuronate synthase [Streptomyces sp. FH025]|uniref:hydroxymethylcytosylglucuronate/cytosylglucurona te synthase n=1 Tax=Streptomyces sp. FH025 TaxID=2815937 RepID=UPI001A9D23D0|nr:hydroxymethylcytosylglucuronate/cytosylglucuronate synthase [Streptomyces sp. FH025]MBO1419480.1 hydroxymethylcytosylglucuronate/cytosylglucuronate synthase [Streptomyces sp. FH025]